MLPTQRRQAILAQVRERAAVSAEDLSRQFGVSVETIRRDLRRLQERGLLERVYGGGAGGRGGGRRRRRPPPPPRAGAASPPPRPPPPATPAASRPSPRWPRRWWSPRTRSSSTSARPRSRWRGPSRPDS